MGEIFDEEYLRSRRPPTGHEVTWEEEAAAWKKQARMAKKKIVAWKALARARGMALAQLSPMAKWSEEERAAVKALRALGERKI